MNVLEATSFDNSLSDIRIITPGMLLVYVFTLLYLQFESEISNTKPATQIKCVCIYIAAIDDSIGPNCTVHILEYAWQFTSTPVPLIQHTHTQCESKCEIILNII